MVEWQCDIRIRLGSGSARGLAEDWGASDSLVLVDPVVGGGIASPVIEALVSVGAVVEDVDLGAPSLAEAARLSRDLEGASVGSVWAVGGGSVLDVAKLVRVGLGGSHGWWRALSAPVRSGFVASGAGQDQLVSLIAIPTTLGTGAEVSPVACFDGPYGKRLTLGADLVPSLAALDPDLTQTMTAQAQRDSLAEIACRLIGPFLAGPSRLAVADVALLRLLGRLRALDRRWHRESGFNAEDRLELAIVGAETRTGLALLGRDVFGSKLWYLSTSLADITGCSKIEANRRILGALIGLVGRGVARFGDPHQLESLLVSLGSASLVEALPSLGLETPGDDDSEPRTARVARHAYEAWGRGLPMLEGLSLEDLLCLFSQVRQVGVATEVLVNA